MVKKIIKGVELIDLAELGDEQGYLCVIENNQQINFDIKRIFYIYKTIPNIVRGKHANKESKFILISVSGKCRVLVDNGIKKEIINLDKPNIALFLDNMVWKNMYDFSEDCVLLVLSNEKYDKNEYITDYDEFIRIIGNS